MSIENLIYNYGGVDYWERKCNEDCKQLCLYEGHHGRHVGDIVNNEVFDAKTGAYLGEICSNGRLIVDRNKLGKSKIKGNFMALRFGRMGHACIPRLPKIEIPAGFEEFRVGIEQ